MLLLAMPVPRNRLARTPAGEGVRFHELSSRRPPLQQEGEDELHKAS